MRRIVVVFLFLCYMSCAERSETLLVIGHRGAMGHETENTLASVEKALELGVDMIEIDVFKVRSGEIVVFHDDQVDRLTNGSGNIEEYTLDDLRKLKLIGGHSIPELHQILDLIDARVSLNIELKGAHTAKDVNSIIEYYLAEKDWRPDQFIISSFNWDELQKARESNAAIAIAVLTEDDPLDAIPIAEDLKAVAINPNFKMLNRENMHALKNAGFKVYTWTVNEPNDIIQMKRIGVDGIFTNYPERLH